MNTKLRLVYYLWVPDGFNWVMDIHWKCLEYYHNVFDDALFLVSSNNNNNENIKYVIEKIKSIGYDYAEIKLVENKEIERESFYVKSEIFDKLGEYDGLTFFAHTKSLSDTYLEADKEKIILWISTMYFFNLNFIDDVKIKLINDKYMSYAIYILYGDWCTTKYNWIYNGTFYWINGKKIENYIKDNNIELPSLTSWTKDPVNWRTSRLYSENILSYLFSKDYAYTREKEGKYGLSFYEMTFDYFKNNFNEDDYYAFVEFYEKEMLKFNFKNKICVYSICKNELKYIEQWYNSVKEADYVVVLDTGSNDGSFEKLKELGVSVEQKIINPWRFDVARNESIKLIPDDYDLKIFVDMDEYFDCGWSDVLRNISFPRDKQCTVLFNLVRDGISWPVERCTNNLVKGFRYPIHESYIIDNDYVKIDLTNKITLNHVPELEAEIGKDKNTLYSGLSKLRYDEEKKVEGTKNFFSYLWYGFFLLKNEKYEESIKVLNELLECNDTNIDLYYLSYTYYLLDFCYDKIV